MVFYDLPTENAKERRNAARFHKMLVRLGYTMMQKSVYVRLFRNKSHLSSEAQAIRQMVPPNSSVFILPMSLDDFKRIVFVSGQSFDMEWFADDVIFA